LSVDIRNVLSDGDIVVTHSLVRFTADDRGTVAAEFFRGALGRAAAVLRGEREPAPDMF